MRACIVYLVAVAFFSTISASPSFAQQMQSKTTVQGELAELRIKADEGLTLVRELISLKREENKLKRLQVAVVALQLRSGSITDIEKRIQTLEDRLTQTKEMSAQMQAEGLRLEEMIGANGTTDSERDEHRTTKKRFDTQIELVTERIWELERKIIDLQNELSAKRREIDSLESIVVEGLGAD